MVSIPLVVNGSSRPNTTRKVTLKDTRLAFLLKDSPIKDDINYKGTFSPVSLRIVLALVAHYDLEFHQIVV